MTRKTFLAVLGAFAATILFAGGLTFERPGGVPSLSADVVRPETESCTSILVGKNASTDGSVMTTHTADCGFCDWTWRHVPAKDHKAGAKRIDGHDVLETLSQLTGLPLSPVNGA